MQLLAASYDNIWPLVERPVLLNVLPGATLITAPIGTWKSFLFFDGPLFGLYKMQNRPVLNRLATRGEVRVVFADQSASLRAVHRVIKRSPAGAESIQTRVFSLAWSLNDWYTFAREQWGEEVLVPWGSLALLLPHLEEHIGGSQRETDQAILDLLPPKEVVTSLNFLVQEADSVFDLTPAERVQVFKHLFGLLGIDEAKEKLLERRRETQASLKLLADQAPRDNKLRLHMQRVAQATAQLQALCKQYPTTQQTLLQNYLTQAFLQDSALLGQEVRMRGDILSWYQKEQSEEILLWLEQQITQLLEQQGRQEAYAKQAQELALRIQTAQARKKELDTRRQKLAQVEVAWDAHLLDEYKARIEVLQQEITQAQHWFPLNAFADAWVTDITLEQAKDLVEQRKQQGQLTKQQMASSKEALTQLDEQIMLVQTQLTQSEAQKQSLLASIEKRDDFYCKMIEGNCPYIEIIKWASVTWLRTQVDTLQEQYERLVKRLEELQQRRIQQEKLITTQQQEIDELLAWFKRVPHAELTTHIAQLQTLQGDLSRVEQQYMQVMQQQASAQQQLQERATLDAAYIQIDETIQDVLTQQQKLTAQAQATSSDASVPKQFLDATKQHIAAIDVQCMLLGQLVDERTVAQTTFKKLEQQDVMLKQLADIFSKELLYVVLDDFLPQLETLINAFLAQMVDYTVHFYLPQASDEKMELAIEVHDEKGKRPVKSLSGGQKSILKFAWIMAVTWLFHAKFVFLDETMNSLDADTIAQVAQVLQDALIQKDIPFYCVTHAPQIQALPFWKRKISLSL